MVETKKTTRHSAFSSSIYAATAAAMVMLVGLLWPATGITAWLHNLLAVR
jgi:hypothetical protein